MEEPLSLIQYLRHDDEKLSLKYFEQKILYYVYQYCKGENYVHLNQQNNLSYIFCKNIQPSCV